MKISTRILLAGLSVMALAGPAYPQSREILLLQQDMVRLSSQMTQLQKSVDQKNDMILSLVEKLVDQVNTLGTDLTAVNGAVTSIKGDNDQTIGDLRGLVESLEHNVGLVNEGLSGVRSQLNTLSQQLTNQSSAEELEGPEEILRSADGDYFGGNYDLAISGYRDFLAKFGNDPRAGSAQLQLGESLFAQKKFDQAIIEYDLFLQKYPGNDKTGSALLKKGLAHAELQQTQPAIAALTRVTREFPNTTEAATAQTKIRELNTRGR